VEGGIEVKCEPNSVVFERNNIEATGSKYVIKSVYSEVYGIEESEGGFMIDSGAHIRKVIVQVGNRREEITLLGTSKTLKRMDINDELLILNEKEWKSNKKFALVVSRKNDIYYRKGLVEFLIASDAKKLKGAKERKLVIG